jgi:hypothetical protein
MIVLNEHEVREIQRKLDCIMAAQDDINAAVSVIESSVAKLADDVTALTAALAAGGTPVDTTALNSAVQDLINGVNGVTALVPAPPVTQ